MSITKLSTTFLLVLGLVGYATSSAVALPLITSATQFGTMGVANPPTMPDVVKALDAAPLIVTSATSPGPGNPTGALANERFQYSDRSHEFTNARTNAAGILTTADTGNLRHFPYYLTGLEYIQTSNDNRDVSDFRYDVTLSAPVTAFLMIDNRDNGTTKLSGDPNTDDPVLTGNLAWVVADGWTRVNSGTMPNGQSDYVGSDEGWTVASNDPAERVPSYNRTPPTQENVAGPGNGLNQFFAIYRKNFAAGSHTGFTKQMGVRDGSTYVVGVAPTMGAIVPADVNLSGVTDLADYNIIKTNFNQSGRTRAQGDLSGDGLVDTRDFRLWKTYAAAGVGSEVELLAGLGIPEPGSVVLAMFALVTLAGTVARRGRR